MANLKDQQKRIDNINAAVRVNKQYFRRERVRNYLAGQVTYGLGDYPAYVDAAPTEYDERLLRQMADAGVKLVQVHEEWNDAVRVWGADKFSAPNPVGMKQFVELCHSLGMKIIPYVSSGYFNIDDPDVRPAFLQLRDADVPYPEKLRCCSNYYNYLKCSHGSAEWRDYILPRTFRVMEEYGFDGIFNDWGYDRTAFFADDVPLPYDPDLEDLLGQIYEGVHARGGIYKLHADRNNLPPCIDRVYDYLWIGEGVKGKSVGVGKDYPTYVVPCHDYARGASGSLDFGFASTIPYLQFPLIKYGRPVLGNNLEIPGVKYWGGNEQEFYKRVKEYNEQNPEGGKVYSLWSAIPDDPNEFPRHLAYLRLYTPMVEEGSVVYMELHECEWIKSPIPETLVASMFVNEKIYLTLSNFAGSDETVTLAGLWRDRESGELASRFTVKPDTIRFLERVGEAPANT